MILVGGDRDRMRAPQRHKKQIDRITLVCSRSSSTADVSIKENICPGVRKTNSHHVTRACSLKSTWMPRVEYCLHKLSMPCAVASLYISSSSTTRRLGRIYLIAYRRQRRDHFCFPDRCFSHVDITKPIVPSGWMGPSDGCIVYCAIAYQQQWEHSAVR